MAVLVWRFHCITSDYLSKPQRVDYFLAPIIKHGSHGECLQVLHQAIPVLLKEKADKDKMAGVYTTLCNMIAKNHSRLEEATEFCEKAINISTHSYTAHNSLGAVLIHRGDHKHAIRAFKRAISLDQTSTAAIFNLALAYINSGKDELAVEALEQVLTIDKNHTSAKIQLEWLKKKS